MTDVMRGKTLPTAQERGFLPPRAPRGAPAPPAWARRDGRDGRKHVRAWHAAAFAHRDMPLQTAAAGGRLDAFLADAAW